MPQILCYFPHSDVHVCNVVIHILVNILSEVPWKMVIEPIIKMIM